MLMFVLCIIALGLGGFAIYAVYSFISSTATVAKIQKIKEENNLLLIEKLNKNADYEWLKFCPKIYLLNFKNFESRDSIGQSVFLYNNGIYNTGRYHLPATELHIGVKNDVIYLLPTVNDYRLIDENHPKTKMESYRINKSDVEYYYQRGDKSTYSVVSGGGSSLGGAVVGGVIGGGVGAVIGSRQNVTSNVEHDDTRETLLYYKKDGVNKVLRLAYESFDILKTCIPEYDIIYVQNRRNQG